MARGRVRRRAAIARPEKAGQIERPAFGIFDSVVSSLDSVRVMETEHKPYLVRRCHLVPLF